MMGSPIGQLNWLVYDGRKGVQGDDFSENYNRKLPSLSPLSRGQCLYNMGACKNMHGIWPINYALHLVPGQKVCLPITDLFCVTNCQLFIQPIDHLDFEFWQHSYLYNNSCPIYTKPRKKNRRVGSKTKHPCVLK